MASHPLKQNRSAGSTVPKRGGSSPAAAAAVSSSPSRVSPRRINRSATTSAPLPLPQHPRHQPQQKQHQGRHRRQSSAPSPLVESAPTTVNASGVSSSSAHATPSSAQLYSSVTSTLAHTFNLTRNRNNGGDPLHNRSIGRTSSRKDLPPLFWYMEAGKWERATQRAKRHPREFKTWVNIKTKSSSHHQAATAAASESSPSGAAGSGTSTRRLALHHACFKLRSAGASPPPTAEDSNTSSSEQPQQQPLADPFVQACHFILLLVSLYPEAAGQRESRHGCLPLHLAAFASCMARTDGGGGTAAGASIGDAASETSSTSSAQQQLPPQQQSSSSPSSSSSNLQRPSALSRRCASDTTTATNMSAIHAEETISGGMADAKLRRQQQQQQRPEQAIPPQQAQQQQQQQQPPQITRPATFVAMRSLQISAKREAAAVQVMNALLDAYPKAIRIDSEGGRLPLHTACAGRATPRVVACLVTAYPAAARHRNKDGFLPLHLAAHWGVSHPAVAITLLKAYPDATVGRNRWERTPLEEALCMAGENGRPHQAALVRALRKHPSFWETTVDDDLLFGSNTAAAGPRPPSAPTRRAAPVDVDESLASTTEDGDDHQHLHYQHLYSPSPREQAVVEDHAEEYGQEVSYQPNNNQNNTAGGVFGRFLGTINNTNNAAASAATVSAAAAAATAAANSSLPLHKLVQNRHWAAVMERLHTNPLQAEEELVVATRGGFMASTGMTALHYACERDPPLQVVQALIEAYPMAVLQRCMPGGCLPLHIICTWHNNNNASVATEDNVGGKIVQALLQADDGGGAAVRDELGNVPLHSACFSGASTAVVAALLAADAKAVVARNHQGSLPIDVCKRLRHANRLAVIHMLSATQEELLRQYHNHQQRKQKRNAAAARGHVKQSPSSGGWSAVAKEAEELNQRYGTPGNNNSDHGPDMRDEAAGPAVEVTFEQQESPELQWI